MIDPKLIIVRLAPEKIALKSSIFIAKQGIAWKNLLGSIQIK